MKWKTFFRPHILERGYGYYLEDKVDIIVESDTEIVAEVEGSETYLVNIGFQNGAIDYMECDCPYAMEGNYCKHMAATLYQAFDDNELTEDDGDKVLGMECFLQRENKEKEEIESLLKKIPEEEKQKLLVNILANNPELKNSLKLEYDFQLDAKQMCIFKNEIQDIVIEHSEGGFVDWNHAFDFCNALESFLEERVEVLAEKGYLLQAFELNNQVFKVIGTIDMDASDGGEGYIAEKCYEEWLRIYKKANDAEKEKIKGWFFTYKEGVLLDFIEEYLLEFRKNELASKEELMEEISELDKRLVACGNSNDCGYIYTVSSGRVSIIEKRIACMKKLGASEDEVDSFCKQNRQFFAVRNMEIEDAPEKGEVEKAIDLLVESKSLDQNKKKLLEQYSGKLIELYKRTGNSAQYVEELKYNLLHCCQTDVKNFKELKKHIANKEEWNLLADEIISRNKGLRIVYAFLYEEERYEQMMDLLEEAGDIFAMDDYLKILSKKLPDRVVGFYADYVTGKMKEASERKQYRYLVQYLNKMRFCVEGMEKAKKIAESWKSEYYRRTAMIDELRKAGY